MTYTDRRWRHLSALLLRTALAALMPALPGCSVEPPSHLHFVREVADHSYTERTEIQPLKLPEATGAPGDVTYTLTPEVPGLSFDPHTRTLTGTPTEVGSYDAQFIATTPNDSAALYFQIVINGKLGFASSVDDQQYETGVEIEPLILPVATGGTPPLTYAVAPGVPGLTFDPHTRTLTGTPGGFLGGFTYQVTYRATDADGSTGVLRFEIGFHWTLRFASSVDDQQYEAGVEIEPLQLPEATGGTPPLTYALMTHTPEPRTRRGADVPGLFFDPYTRTLSGTPSEVDTYQATYLATDAEGATGVLLFTISVYRPFRE